MKKNIGAVTGNIGKKIDSAIDNFLKASGAGFFKRKKLKKDIKEKAGEFVYDVAVTSASTLVVDATKAVCYGVCYGATTGVKLVATGTVKGAKAAGSAAKNVAEKVKLNREYTPDEEEEVVEVPHPEELFEDEEEIPESPEESGEEKPEEDQSDGKCKNKKASK